MLNWLRQHFSSIPDQDDSEDILGNEFNILTSKLIPADSLLNLPYSAIGKLHFFKGGRSKRPGTCTGFFVGEGILMTAAHCVMSADGQWHEDILFVGNLGQKEIDIHNVHCVVVPSIWGAIAREPSFHHDYAFLKMAVAENKDYLRLAPSGLVRSVQVIGYGKELPDRMIEIAHGESEFENEGGHLSTKINPMGAGSSGSPWINQGDVISLSSHYEAASKVHLSGPVFDQKVFAMLEFVAIGC